MPLDLECLRFALLAEGHELCFRKTFGDRLAFAGKFI